MMEKENDESTAADDAEKVDAAIQLLTKGNANDAAKLLLDVIQRTPKPYVREFEADGKRYVRFWDAEEFMHFVTDQREHIKCELIWLKSAYPRAFYYMGFLLVKAGDPTSAIKLLDAGYQVEAHPMFLLEKGKALSMLKRHQESIACYEAAFNHQGIVRATVRAVALRGKGVQLIDLNRLDEAEQVFEASLKLDPNNHVALNELQYISRLRRGAPPAPLETIATGAQGLVCAICGNPLEGGGKVHNIDGRVVLRCEKCAALLPGTGGSPALPAAASGANIHFTGKKPEPKRWWQFWRK